MTAIKTEEERARLDEIFALVEAEKPRRKPKQKSRNRRSPRRKRALSRLHPSPGT